MSQSCTPSSNGLSAGVSFWTVIQSSALPEPSSGVIGRASAVSIRLSCKVTWLIDVPLGPGIHLISFGSAGGGAAGAEMPPGGGVGEPRPRPPLAPGFEGGGAPRLFEPARLMFLARQPAG